MAAPISVRNFNNTAPPTNLTANIDNSAGTSNIPVTSTAGYPPVPFTGCMERNTQQQEFVLVTSIIDANHFNVVRGYNGTPAVAHLATATFEHCVGAIDFQEANSHHTDTTRDDHLQYVPVNGSRAITGLQSFTAGINTTALTVAGYPGGFLYTRFLGATAAIGPPGGTGSYLVGDWIRDPAGTEWTCVAAGSPGTWVPQPGRLVSRVIGPGAAHDVINTSYNVINYTFPAIRNIQYVIDVRIQGTIVTAVPGYINATIQVSAGLVSPAIYIMSLNTTALAVGGVSCGSISTVCNVVTTTTNATVTVTARSSGAGAWRLAGGACEMILRRV